MNIAPNLRAPLSAGEPFEELLDPADDQDYYGAVRAFDPSTGDLVWQHRMNDRTWAGVLSTASDLVFSGGREGYFYALDAATGALLWRVSLGGQVNSGPMTTWSTAGSTWPSRPVRGCSRSRWNNSGRSHLYVSGNPDLGRSPATKRSFDPHEALSAIGKLGSEPYFPQPHHRPGGVYALKIGL